MLRSVLAVLAGFFTMTLLVAVYQGIIGLILFGGISDPLDAPRPSDWVTLAILALDLGTAVVGGYVCARLAGRAEVKHALALAALGLLMGAASTAASWGMEPVYYALARTLGMPAAVVFGGMIRSDQVTAVQPAP